MKLNQNTFKALQTKRNMNFKNIFFLTLKFKNKFTYFTQKYYVEDKVLKNIINQNNIEENRF